MPGPLAIVVHAMLAKLVHDAMDMCGREVHHAHERSLRAHTARRRAEAQEEEYMSPRRRILTTYSNFPSQYLSELYEALMSENPTSLYDLPLQLSTATRTEYIACTGTILRLEDAKNPDVPRLLQSGYTYAMEGTPIAAADAINKKIGGPQALDAWKKSLQGALKEVGMAIAVEYVIFHTFDQGNSRATPTINLRNVVADFKTSEAAELLDQFHLGSTRNIMSNIHAYITMNRDHLMRTYLMAHLDSKGIFVSISEESYPAHATPQLSDIGPTSRFLHLAAVNAQKSLLDMVLEISKQYFSQHSTKIIYKQAGRLIFKPLSEWPPSDMITEQIHTLGSLDNLKLLMLIHSRTPTMMLGVRFAIVSEESEEESSAVDVDGVSSNAALYMNLARDQGMLIKDSTSESVSVDEENAPLVVPRSRPQKLLEDSSSHSVRDLTQSTDRQY